MATLTVSRGPGVRRAGRWAGRSLLRHLVLIGLSAVFLLPFFWMVATSLKTNVQIVQWPPQWIPHPFEWSNYRGALDDVPLLHYTRNTAVITFFSIIGAVVSNTLVAYGFSRVKWRGRDALFVIVLASMMLPYQVTMIPLFIVFARIHWINTYFPLIVPTFLGNAFYIFLLRQFFLGIPRDYIEAARLEGASELQILWQVVVPLAKPALMAVVLFQFLFSWNDFLAPLLYLNDQSKFTLSLALANMQSALGLSQFGQIMAAATMIVLPAVVIFMLTQRYFVSGIATSGLKG